MPDLWQLTLPCCAQVPKVLWKYTAQQVLTMEYAPGVKINRTAEIEAMGVDRKELARRTVECYLQQLLTYGFFHAGAPCSHFHRVIILSSIFWLNLSGRGYFLSTTVSHFDLCPFPFGGRWLGNKALLAFAWG